MATVGVNTLILGGGLSALFAAKSLLNEGNRDFKIVTGSRRSVGGYALWGDMKVGLPPAGSATSQWLSENFYRSATADFIAEYRDYLERPGFTDEELRRIPILPQLLDQKYYYSYIIPRQKGRQMVNDLFGLLHREALTAEASRISRRRDRYEVHLANGDTLSCQILIIASGRNPEILSALGDLGQEFEETQDVLTGCRVTFEPPDLRHFRQLDCANYQIMR